MTKKRHILETHCLVPHVLKLFTLLISFSKVESACPDCINRDWLQVDAGACYCISPEYVTAPYLKASIACHSVGAKWELGTIGSKEENDFLTTVIGVSKALYPLWVGIQYDQVKNQWYWSTRIPVESSPFQNWEAGSPDPQKGNCSAITEAGEWRSVPCSTKVRLICKQTYRKYNGESVLIGGVPVTNPNANPNKTTIAGNIGGSVAVTVATNASAGSRDNEITDGSAFVWEYWHFILIGIAALILLIILIILIICCCRKCCCKRKVKTGSTEVLRTPRDEEETWATARANNNNDHLEPRGATGYTRPKKVNNDLMKRDDSMMLKNLNNMGGYPEQDPKYFKIYNTEPPEDIKIRM